MSNFEIGLEIYLVSIQNNFSYEYQSAMDIDRSFCVDEQINRTFQIDRTQWKRTKEFLCSNLSAGDLKGFLMQVQQQLDEQFLVRYTSNGMIRKRSVFRRIRDR